MEYDLQQQSLIDDQDDVVLEDCSRKKKVR